MKNIVLFYLISLPFLSCNQDNSTPSFNKDLELLQRFEDLCVLQQGQSYLAAVPSAHGQIFAISTNGREDINRCYFNRKSIMNGSAPLNIISLGGASRLMFGPQFGPYNVFFKPGLEQSDDNVRTHTEMNKGKFKLTAQSDSSLHCSGDLNIENAQSYTFNIHVERDIILHTASAIQNHLNIDNIKHTKFIGYTVNSRMCNIGTEQWTREKGLLALWDLSCMLPAHDNIAIIPMESEEQHYTNYFTTLDSSRIKLKDNTLFYKADAQYMNKIGLFPEYCKGIYGAYSPSLKQLVLNTYSFDKDGIYINSENPVPNPYRGDVINIFNGEVNPAEDRDWPFYEFESTSASYELRPGEEIAHRHSIFIFVGEPEELNTIARKTLEIDLKETTRMFE